MRTLIALSAVLLSLACKDLDPKVAMFECRAKALLPLVGDVQEANRLVVELETRGELDLTRIAAQVGKGYTSALAAKQRLMACDPPAQMPDAGLSTL